VNRVGYIGNHQTDGLAATQRKIPRSGVRDITELFGNLADKGSGPFANLGIVSQRSGHGWLRNTSHVCQIPQPDPPPFRFVPRHQSLRRLPATGASGCMLRYLSRFIDHEP